MTWQKRQFLVALARDTARGMTTTAEGGWAAGGRAPYGYRRAIVDDDGEVVQVLQLGEHKATDRFNVTLVLGPAEEVAVVKDIYRQFLAGKGYRAIALDLNARGIPSAKGGAWAGSSIREILTNRRYTGDAVWNRRPKGKFFEVNGGKPSRKPKRRRQRVRRNDPAEWVVVPEAHAATISRADFRAAQRRIEGSRRNSGYQARNRRTPYSLSGLLFCGCGNPMWGQATQRPLANGKVRSHRYYICSGGHTGRTEG